MDKIEELENKALALVQEIAELKKGQNAGEWKPQNGETYYFMSYTGNVNSNRWAGDCVDISYSKYTPLFKTQEECQKYIDYRKALKGQSYKFSEAEWNDENIDKYFIYYSYRIKAWIIEKQQYRHALGVTHFKTFDDAQFMIDNYSEEMSKWGLN